MTHSLTRSLPLFAAILFFCSAALAGAGECINTDKTGLALRGYDPVAYFTQNAAVEGDFQIATQYDGATYWFATEGNKQQFMKDPARYVPQFGGYCAFGVSIGKKFPADPTVFKVIDGKLYVNLNKAIGVKFSEDTAAHLKKAESNWPTIKDIPAGEIK